MNEMNAMWKAAEAATDSRIARGFRMLGEQFSERVDRNYPAAQALEDAIDYVAANLGNEEPKPIVKIEKIDRLAPSEFVSRFIDGERVKWVGFDFNPGQRGFAHEFAEQPVDQGGFFYPPNGGYVLNRRSDLDDKSRAGTIVYVGEGVDPRIFDTEQAKIVLDAAITLLREPSVFWRIDQFQTWARNRDTFVKIHGK